MDTTGAGDGFTAGFLHKLIEVTDAWQAEEKEVDGFEGPMPRGHQACVLSLVLSLLALLVQRLRASCRADTRHVCVCVCVCVCVSE